MANKVSKTKNSHQVLNRVAEQGRPMVKASSAGVADRNDQRAIRVSAGKGKKEENDVMQTSDLHSTHQSEPNDNRQEEVSIFDLIADLGPLASAGTEPNGVSISDLVQEVDGANPAESSPENVSILDLIADLSTDLPAPASATLPSREQTPVPEPATVTPIETPEVAPMNETKTRPLAEETKEAALLPVSAAPDTPEVIPQLTKPVVARTEVAPEVEEKPAIELKEKSKRSKKSKPLLDTDFDRVKLDYQFHRILQQLEAVPTLEAPLTLGVASTLRGEGRTTIAMGLASAIVQEIPLPVVLLETDLTNPSLAEDLKLTNRGLCEYLRGEIELDDLTQPTALNDLVVITAGDCKGEALKLLRSGRFSHLMTILNQQFAAVIVDLPPLSMTGEVSRVISQLDRVLMVVEAGSTPRKLVKSAMEIIPEEKLMGVLLNRTRPAFGFFQWVRRLFR